MGEPLRLPLNIRIPIFLKKCLSLVTSVLRWEKIGCILNPCVLNLQWVADQGKDMGESLRLLSNTRIRIFLKNVC